jgi:hypothetical protein
MGPHEVSRAASVAAAETCWAGMWRASPPFSVLTTVTDFLWLLLPLFVPELPEREGQNPSRPRS